MYVLLASGLQAREFDPVNDTTARVLELNQKADAALTHGQFARMLEYYLDCARLLEKRDVCDSLRMLGHYNLGRTMYYLNLKEEAMERLRSTFATARACKDAGLRQKSATSLGALHNELGHYDSARHYLDFALSLLDPRYDFAELSRTYSILAEVSLRTGSSVNEIGTYCRQARRFAERSGKPDLIGFAEIKFSFYSERLKDYRQAYEHLIEAEKYYRQAGSKSGIIYAVDRQAFVLSKLGRSEEVYRLLNTYNKLKDSVYRDEMAAQVAEMNARYETEKRARENMELAQVNELQSLQLDSERQKRITQVILFGGVIVLLGLASLFLLSRTRYRQRVEYQKKLTEEQRKLFQGVVDAEEKERKRIAQELHDGIGQLLSTAKLHASALEEELPDAVKPLARQSSSLIDQAVAEVRAVSHNLMPASLIRSGLKVAIENLAGQIHASNQLKVTCNVSGLDGHLSDSAEVILFRLVQELFNNALKHAEATSIGLDIGRSTDSLVIRFSDDGKGFNPQTAPSHNGLGLRNVYSRAGLLNGRIEITSAPGAGTLTVITIPVENSHG